LYFKIFNTFSKITLITCCWWLMLSISCCWWLMLCISCILWLYISYCILWLGISYCILWLGISYCILWLSISYCILWLICIWIICICLIFSCLCFIKIWIIFNSFMILWSIFLAIFKIGYASFNYLNIWTRLSSFISSSFMLYILITKYLWSHNTFSILLIGYFISMIQCSLYINWNLFYWLNILILMHLSTIYIFRLFSSLILVLVIILIGILYNFGYNFSNLIYNLTWISFRHRSLWFSYILSFDFRWINFFSNYFFNFCNITYLFLSFL